MFYINAKGLPFDSKAIDLICWLFMLSEKISMLRNQPANNIESNSIVNNIKYLAFFLYIKN